MLHTQSIHEARDTVDLHVHGGVLNKQVRYSVSYVYMYRPTRTEFQVITYG